jgi:hypothetical protein
MDSRASHNLMPKTVMEELRLEVTKAYHDLYSFNSRRVQCLGVIKYLVVTLFQLPMMIQVDIGGHPPFPNGSKQFSGNFGNLLFLAGFNFRGHFEGPNEGFSRSRFSTIVECMIDPQK